MFTPDLLCAGGEVEAGVLCIPGLARSPGLCSWPPAQSEALALHPQPELGALAARWLWARSPVLKQRAVISLQREHRLCLLKLKRERYGAPPNNKIWNLI